MSDKLLRYIVIFLAILIIFCFVLLLYGLYSKISNPEGSLNTKTGNYSLKLANNERIIDVKIIDEHKILAVISNDNQLSFIVYNLKQNKIISRIGR